MATQNQVKITLVNCLPQVVEAVGGANAGSRTSIANGLCDRFALLDHRGKRQTASCLKTLRGLESSGLLTLPPPRSRQPRKPGVRRLDEAVPSPVGVPDRADEIKDTRLVLVEDESDMRVWNELMIREHPLGHGPLVGRQLRYLVRSSHGILGAAGFGSCALRLACRDAWIGWDPETRRSHLDRVVCMSRFLIRPGTNCGNLASRVLGLLHRRFPEDFESRYGYRPWLLESFVDTDRHSGCCYRAANWLLVGKTGGRGRQDSGNRHDKSKKDVYVYVLDGKFRDVLGVPEPIRFPPLDVTDCGNSENWVEKEFRGAPLGDKRLEKRLMSIVREKGKAPVKSFARAVRGDRAAIAGYYRFIDSPAESEVDMDSILRPHRDRTLQRMNNAGDTLCVHDTTDLNLDTLDACEGLGVIGKNQTGTRTRGLRLHSSLAVDAESGIPLGLLHQNCYAPKIKTDKGKKKDPRSIPIERKETNRWITSLRTCSALTAELDSRSRVIHVMDREADFFDLFRAWSEDGRDQMIVRAKHDRATEFGTPLFQLARESELLGEITVDVRRMSARRKAGKRAARPQRMARQAKIEVRSTPISIRPPKWGVNSGKKPVRAWLVHARERDKPKDGGERIEWFLICTFPVESLETAAYVVSCYAKRWRVEDWHRTLKTCCQAEESAVETAERQKRLLAINMVLAWRIMLLMMLGRELPELPPEILFTDTEMEVLEKCAGQLSGPSSPKNLNDYMILTSCLGGYQNRKNDGPPGAVILSRGLMTLNIMSMGYSLHKLE